MATSSLTQILSDMLRSALAWEEENGCTDHQPRSKGVDRLTGPLHAVHSDLKESTAPYLQAPGVEVYDQLSDSNPH